MNNLPIVNIYNFKKNIYLFLRDKDYNLSIIEDKNFYPYCYTPDIGGSYLGIDGTKLKKLVLSEPSELRELKGKDYYESDVNFTKRYLIDKIDNFEKTSIKYCFIDIETLKSNNEFPSPLTAKYPITSISLYNGQYKKLRNWFISDFGTNIKTSEVELMKEFITYMRKAKFDLWLSWYNCDFDYPYLYRRFEQLPQSPFFEKTSHYNNFATAISPIQKVRGGNKLYDNFFPAGTSIVDYLLLFKKIYKNEKSNALDAVMEKYLGTGKEFKDVDFAYITEDIRQRNIGDVQGMIDLEAKFKFIPLYDEIRRFTKVGWEDFQYNSRLIDSLLLTEAKEKKLILPNGKSSEGLKEGSQGIATTINKKKFEGAFREISEPGVYFNLGKYDISGAYLYTIIDLCLDSSNIVGEETNTNLTVQNDVPKEQIIKVSVTDKETQKIINTYFIKQDKNALLPSMVLKLINEKNKYKELKNNTNKEDPNYKDIELKYEAVKAIVLSAWGVLGCKFFRLFDLRIAGLITSQVRGLLHYLKDKAEQEGYAVVYNDTDGLMIQDGGKDISVWLNSQIQKWSTDNFNKPSSIVIDYEGHFDKILLLALCHYRGYFKSIEGTKPVKEDKGIEVKRKDSTSFMARFQDILIDKVLNKETREQCIEWIKLEMMRMSALYPGEYSFWVSLPHEVSLYKTEITNKKGKTYTKDVPILARALRNTQELLPNFIKPIGEKFYWAYVKSEDPKKNVLAFDEKNKEHIKDIDFDMMIKRNILNKVEVIFEAMKWDMAELLPIKVKKPRKSSKQAKNEANLTIGMPTIEEDKLNRVIDKLKTSKKKANLSEIIDNKGVSEQTNCDFDKCKYNENNLCINRDTNPESCPKNNNQSIFEKEELIKPNLTPYYSE